MNFDACVLACCVRLEYQILLWGSALGHACASVRNATHLLINRLYQYSPVLQGLCSDFQMAGANHLLMTQIQSKTVQFSYFSEIFGKSMGANGVFWKLKVAIAPVAAALTKPLSCLASMLSTGYHFETVTPVSSGFWFISLYRKQCAFAVKEKTLL